MRLPRPFRRKTVEEIKREGELADVGAAAWRKAARLGASPKHSQTRVVSTETVVCRRWDEVHTALLLIHEDGTIEVKCPGQCPDCEYGFVEF